MAVLVTVDSVELLDLRELKVFQVTLVKMDKLPAQDILVSLDTRDFLVQVNQDSQAKKDHKEYLASLENKVLKEFKVSLEFQDIQVLESLASVAILAKGYLVIVEKLVLRVLQVIRDFLDLKVQ